MTHTPKPRATLMDVLDTIDSRGTDLDAFLAVLAGAVDGRSAAIERDLEVEAAWSDAGSAHDEVEYELGVELPASDRWLTVGRDDRPFLAEEQAIIESAAAALDALDSGRGNEAPPMVPTDGATVELDELTGLLSRDSYRSILDDELGRGLGVASILAIGLDDLSVVNDTLGYEYGDHVLQTMASRIRTSVRECDVVARLGDTVFGVYCPGMDVDLGADVLSRLQIALGVPVHLDQGQVTLTASGSVVASEDGVDAADMLVRADSTMRLAKSFGGGHVLRWDDDVEDRLVRRRAFAADLQDAMANNQLTTALDPIVCLPSGDTVGREARVRWLHPDRGLLEREDFMDLVETIGRVADIERAVIALAKEAGDTEVTAVQLSHTSIRRPEHIDWILDQFPTVDAASALIVDVAEDAVADAEPVALDNLDRLRERGVGVVLDEFGRNTGSLRTLLSFPFDGVRVHPDFVDERDPVRMRSALRAVLAAADELGISVIHAGVDTEHHYRVLRRLYESIDVDAFYAQGRVARHHTIPELYRDAVSHRAAG